MCTARMMITTIEREESRAIGGGSVPSVDTGTDPAR